MTNKNGDTSQSWENVFWSSRKYNERIKIKSGFFLHSFCPFCLQALTKENLLSLEVVNKEGEVGMLELSPYLNTYNRQTDIKLTEGEEVEDMRCPHCHKSLKVEGKTCGLGDARVASFLIGISKPFPPRHSCCFPSSLTENRSDFSMWTVRSWGP